MAKLTLTTNWVRDRKTNIAGDEILAMHVTSLAELIGDAKLSSGDQVQFWHCGAFMFNDTKTYCTTYHHMIGDSTYWDTDELKTFQHYNDYTDLTSMLT